MAGKKGKPRRSGPIDTIIVPNLTTDQGMPIEVVVLSTKDIGAISLEASGTASGVDSGEILSRWGVEFKSDRVSPEGITDLDFDYALSPVEGREIADLLEPEILASEGSVIDTRTMSGLSVATPAEFESLRRLQLLEAEFAQRMEFARVEHARRMQVIEAEAALVAERRQQWAGVFAPIASRAEEKPGTADLESIRELLTTHLGSPEAADAWLNSPDTGYPTTAMYAIRSGKADLVMADLEQQWGPSPAYA